MSKEEFYKPTEGEINEAVDSAEEQMGESGEPQPTSENINRVMMDIAAQFGEKFKKEDPKVPEKDIIDKYQKEGWNLVEIITNAAKVSVSHEEGKEIKIIGLGQRFLVFEKEKKEN